MTDNPVAMKKRSRTELLREANKLITGDRHSDYGDAAANFERIATGWSEILGADIPAWKVALCMDWVKTCRLINDPSKRDSWVDKMGYAALGGEISLTTQADEDHSSS